MLFRSGGSKAGATTAQPVAWDWSQLNPFASLTQVDPHANDPNPKTVQGSKIQAGSTPGGQSVVSKLGRA